jgi:cytochrome c
MKTKILILAALCLFSCGKKEKPANETITYENEAPSPADRGRELFEGDANCISCHKPDNNVLAPSLPEIAAAYKKKNGDMAAFLKGKADPIVDPTRYAIMKTNFSVTENMSETDLEALETYIRSFSK